MMTEIRHIVNDAVLKAYAHQNLSLNITDIVIQKPIDARKGDYASPIGFVLAKQLQVSPQDALTPVVALLKQNTLFKDVVIEQGFLNLFLSHNTLYSYLSGVLRHDFSFSPSGKGKKVLIEFLSANPTGPLTLPNGRGGFLGDTLTNVLQKAGYEVNKEYYVNDRGNQITLLGKSVYYVLFPDDISQGEDMYYRGEYLVPIAQMIQEKHASLIEDKDMYQMGKIALDIILDTLIKPSVAAMGIEFHTWFSEDSLHQEKKVQEVLAFLKEKDLVYEKEGALYMKTTDFGDDKDRVLIKSDGEATYFYSDVAYHKDKLDRGYDLLIDIFGADHHGYVGRLKSAVEALGHEKEKLHIIIMQLIKLIKDGSQYKMSKRKGTYISLNWLIEEVGLDVTRFFFLMYNVDTHLNFDLDVAKKQSDENPVFYVQYAHARICSIIRQVKDFSYELEHFSLLTHEKEIALLKTMLAYPDLIENISKNYQVHLLCQYAIDIAHAFHAFYRECRVIQDDEALQNARMALIVGAKHILADVLYTLGIQAPQRM